MTLDGESLSAAEIKRLLAHSDGLALIRGVEAFRETGIDTGHAFPRLRAFAAGGSTSAKNI